MLAATPRRTRYRLSPVFVSAFLRRVQPLVLQCFVDGWEEGLAIAELKATVRDYFGDFRKFLTKFFFDRLALLMMGKVCGLPIYYRTMVCAMAQRSPPPVPRLHPLLQLSTVYIRQLLEVAKEKSNVLRTFRLRGTQVAKLRSDVQYLIECFENVRAVVCALRGFCSQPHPCCCVRWWHRSL